MFWGLFDSSHRRLNSRWFVGGWNFPQNPLLFFNGNAKVFCDFRRRFCRRWSGWPNEVWISVDQRHVVGFPDTKYTLYLTHFVKPWPNETDGFEKKSKINSDSVASIPGRNIRLHHGPALDLRSPSWRQGRSFAPLSVSGAFRSDRGSLRETLWLS